MRSGIRILAATAAAIGLAAGVAHAQGVVMTSKVTTTGSAPQTTEVQLDANHMRAEMVDGSGGRTAVVFDSTKGVVDIIDITKKTYMEMTKAQIEQMGAQMSQMMAQAEAAMANMPPAQRAQMEAMMRGRGGMMGMGAPAKPEYKKVGSGQVGKWTCDRYEGTVNGQKTAEVCTVEPTAFGLTAADFAVMQKLAEMMKAMVPPQMSSMMQMGVAGAAGYPGIPVKSVNTVMGRETTTEITDVKKQAIPASAFEIPAGFTKQDMPMMGGGRGRQ